jgi:hypothetical protein
MPSVATAVPNTHIEPLLAVLHPKFLYPPASLLLKSKGLSRLERIAEAAVRAKNGGWGYGGVCGSRFFRSPATETPAVGNAVISPRAGKSLAQICPTNMQ